MPENESKGCDVFGIKPFGETIKIVAKAAVDGAAAFLSRICLPAAEEFGLLLKDKVSTWRANNLVMVVSKAETKYNQMPNANNKHAHPRLVAKVVENSSWIEDDRVQNQWAGLLVSSCSDDGKDESNLLFIDLMGMLTNSEALLLDHVCENAKKTVAPGGWIAAAESLHFELDELRGLMGVLDEHRIDRELDHLRSIALIDGGFSAQSTEANIEPSCLALHMYVRCQGHSGSPVEYFENVNRQLIVPFDDAVKNFIKQKKLEMGPADPINLLKKAASKILGKKGAE